MGIKIQGLSETLRGRGDVSKSKHYADISAGLWTKAVHISENRRGWPEHENDALSRAQIAGKSLDEIRSLVKDLEALRPSLFRTADSYLYGDAAKEAFTGENQVRAYSDQSPSGHAKPLSQRESLPVTSGSRRKTQQIESRRATR